MWKWLINCFIWAYVNLCHSHGAKYYLDYRTVDLKWQAPNLDSQYNSGMEGACSDKWTSLKYYRFNYTIKKFYSTGPKYVIFPLALDQTFLRLQLKFYCNKLECLSLCL